jgi:hypothetical protein
VESLENQQQVFDSSHRPWKSLRDSHITTALATMDNIPFFKELCGTPDRKSETRAITSAQGACKLCARYEV